MIRVFVWPYRGSDVAWGHAAMEVGGGQLSGSVYISWWPESRGRQPKTIHGKAINGDLYCVGAIYSRKYADDVKGEDFKPPSQTIIIDGKSPTTIGLDETAIKTWWGKLRGTGTTDWCTLGPNCSTIVAYALHIGGGEMFSSMWSNSNVVWTPNAVADYAKDIRSGIAYARLGPTTNALGDADGGLPPGGLNY
jgi:hypothetical protein